MGTASEMALVIVMILLWSLELFNSLLERDFILIMLSFLLMLLWFDELFPIRKDFRPGIGLKMFITALIVLAQGILRFFV